jgi:hypothetical protein
MRSTTTPEGIVKELQDNNTIKKIEFMTKNRTIRWALKNVFCLPFNASA